MTTRTWVMMAMLALAGCGDDEPEGEPDEQGLDAEDQASEGKTDEAPYKPTDFCLENGSIPNGPNVGPSALGQSVLGTSGRADGFGNETWGAEYGAELSLKGVAGGPNGTETVARGELVGRATVFDLSANVVRIVMEGSSAADGKAGFDANLTVLDRFTYPLFSYEGNFSDEKNFSASLFTATTGVPLVPGLAPVEVNASIVGQLGYLVSGMVLPNGIAVLVRPQASILVTANAHVGAAGVASARVEGQLELLTISVPIQAALTFTVGGGVEFSWDVRVDMDADWLAGDIEVIASAFGEDRYRKSIAQWDGFHLNTTHMTSGAGDIFPGAPSDCGPSELARADEMLDDFVAPTLVPAQADLDEVIAVARGETATLGLGRRMHALASLGQAELPSAGTVGELRRAFDAGEGEVRRAAGYALGSAAAKLRPFDPQAVGALLYDLEGRLHVADETEQVLLLEVLGNVGADRSVDAIDDALESESVAVRAAAVTALRFIPGHRVDDRMRSVMLDDREPKVREAAVRAAESRDTDAAFAAIAASVRGDEDPWITTAGVHALGRAVTRSTDAVEALEEIEASSDSTQLRAVATNYLARVREGL